MAAPSLTVPRNRPLQSKHVLFIVYGLLILVVLYTRDLSRSTPHRRFASAMPAFPG